MAWALATLPSTAATPTDDHFDARRDAVSRNYRYRILARRSSSPFEQNRALSWPHKWITRPWKPASGPRG